MPVLFVGHGSPMNAIASNPFTKMLVRVGESLPRPKAILVISAHWLTEGSRVTAMRKPKTIHDFFGFPQELFDVQYPAPGSAEFAALVKECLSPVPVLEDADSWGLDHGTWSILRHMFPRADVPVVQLSIDRQRDPEYHLALGRKLAQLRQQGILIVGSGNLVHNLQAIRWGSAAQPFDWAIEFDDWIKTCLISRDVQALIHDFHSSPAGRLSIPTLEHYLPLLYVLGASDAGDDIEFLYEEIQNSSISMRSFLLGRLN